MLGLGNKSSLKETSALKNKRYGFKYKYDRLANRGLGGFVKVAKTKTDRNDYR